MDLNQGIESLKGVGQKSKEILNNAGIYNLMDLILYFPRDYENLSDMDSEGYDEEKKYLVRAEFISASRPVRTRTGKSMITLNFISSGGTIKALYFNMPYIGRNFKTDTSYNLYGKFKRNGNTLTITNPKILKDEEAGLIKNNEGDETYSQGRVIARYPLHESLTDNTLKKLINQVLEKIKIRENLPVEILNEYNLLDLDSSIRRIHNPETEGFEKALERLKFQELFAYAMKLAAAKDLRQKDNSGIAFSMSSRLSEFKESLPYTLTAAQSRSIREILIDQKKPMAMNRLLQGDVGSGKTIVALTALFNITENGYKGVLMAPTEILAQQHYKDAKNLLEKFGVEVLLLIGSTKASEKKEIKEKLKAEKPLVLIGTHAVIEDDIEIEKLGMIITDEQHRFGVNQRTKLINKSRHADVLVMSATPIPRTLAMYMYSDLDLSIIDELPPGRKKIDTLSFTRKKEKEAYLRACVEIQKGRQVYIVTPLIEDSDKLKLVSVEKLYDKLKSGIFSPYTIEMLHGRMKGKEKNEIMKEFKAGNIDVLISTTVIEVGVNVPNASVMIIENAERFGLSQLHQLRGRVGRGEYSSICILISDSNSEDTIRRMKIMTSTNDGFKVAEEDLKMRGSGAILGTNQSGDSGLVISNFINDYELFLKADKWAKKVFYSDKEEYVRIKNEILEKMDKTMQLICMN